MMSVHCVCYLNGIVLDWSDAERKGLEKVMGKETAERLMIGCLIHYSRSYQHVAERVRSSLSLEIRDISKNAFCKIAYLSLKFKSEVKCLVY